MLRAAAGADYRMSVATWLEATIVADARSAAHGARLDEILSALGVEIVPVGLRQGEVVLARCGRRH